MYKALFLGVILGVVSGVVTAQEEGYFEEDIGAWHFHTYFFEVNPSKTAEALAFRRGLRRKINDGTLAECSLNQIRIGWTGPHPISQWELCCNKTSFNTAHAWHVQNHGNLSVLVHPLTIYDQLDHMGRATWIGKEVVLDPEVFNDFPIIPRPRPCPKYPEYSDELPENLDNPVYEIPIPGTEDYDGLNKNFNISRDPY